MKLHAGSVAALAVTNISAHSLSIAQTPYAQSIQVGQGIGVQLWEVSNIGSMSEADIARWVALKPELVILGTGTKHQFLNPKLAVQLVRSGVGIECMTTAAAARTYNVLLEEGRNVLGAFVIEQQH